MKTSYTLLSLCFVFIASAIDCQEWAPIGAEWRYRSELSPTNEVWHSLISVEKDTIVAGQLCRKYVVYNESNQENMVNHIGFTFERNDSVFIWDEDAFLLTYDFSANISDTITIPSPIIEITEGGSTDSFKVVLDSIGIENVGFSQTPVQKYYTHSIDGTLDYYDNGYYRTIGSQYIWGGLTSSLLTVGLVYENLRCYKDEQIEILGISMDCSNPTANNELKKQSLFHIYPNPVKDYLNIDFDNNVDENWTIIIYDNNGRQVDTWAINTSQTTYKLPINTYPTGIYYFGLVDDSGRWLKSFSWVKN